MPSHARAHTHARTRARIHTHTQVSELEGRAGAWGPDDHRLAAIRIYQGLGFLPEDRHPTHAERWAIVIANLLASANL